MQFSQITPAYLQADFYKFSHIAQYDRGVLNMYMNLTARSAAHAPAGVADRSHIRAGGMQATWMFLQDLWDSTFFRRPWEEIERNLRVHVMASVGPIDLEPWQKLWRVGRLPISAAWVPEGSRVALGSPVMVWWACLAGSLHQPDFAWLPAFLETQISSTFYQMLNVLTTAYDIRCTINEACIATGVPREVARWLGHDFSARGHQSVLSAGMSGMMHAFVSAGTDTVAALPMLERFYGTHPGGELIAGSVPATEHTVMCLGISQRGERETIRRLITEVYPRGIISIVMDTEDFFESFSHMEALKDVILAREPDANGMAKVVCRPDSGDQLRVILGYDPGEVVHTGSGRYYVKDEDRYISHNEAKGTLHCLRDIFGGDITSTGHRQLHPRVGAIYGDGMTPSLVRMMYQRMEADGWAASNLLVGVGSYAYSGNTRDTWSVAIKATSALVADAAGLVHSVPLQKIVKTDSSKRSARGAVRSARQEVGGSFQLVQDLSFQEAVIQCASDRPDGMPTRFIEGAIQGHMLASLAEIRQNIGVF
jgi:nicotinamide phosphoribosyltransferase